jgi:hypothetical protein
LYRLQFETMTAVVIAFVVVLGAALIALLSAAAI